MPDAPIGWAFSFVCISDIRCSYWLGLYQKNNQYIYPTKPNNSLIEYFGTSCSCAYVCALITLLKQKNISVNINDVMSLLKISCNKTNNLDDCIQGLGTINLTQLLE